MVAFRAAIAAGAQAIETDIHLTRDDVVVLSHDGTLKRCYGEAAKIIDRDWDTIRGLKSLREPKDTMPRLLDLLDLLSEPGHEDIWCLLDIKIDNNPHDVMRFIGETLASHSSANKAAKSWKHRVVLGIWTAKFLPLCLEYVPGFPIMNIGFSVFYSRHFLEIENVSFNMLFPQLIVPPGPGFRREVQQRYKRPLVSWTVNRKTIMKWCIRNRLDGVITDDPKLFLQLRDTCASEKQPWLPLSVVDTIRVLVMWTLMTTLAWLYRKRIGEVAKKSMLVQRAQ